MRKKEFIDFLRNVEARVAPIGILFLILFAIVSIVFVFSPSVVAVTSVSEDFSGDSPGHNPSDTWYTFENTSAHSGSSSVVDWEGADWQGHGQTFHAAVSSSGYEMVLFNYTSSPVNYTFVNFSMRENATDQAAGFGVMNGTWNDDTKCLTYIKFDNDASFDIRVSGGGYTTLFTYSANTWYDVSLRLNYTDHTVHCIVNSTDYGWYSMWYNHENTTMLKLGCDESTPSGDVYFDNFTLSNLYTGGVVASNFSLSGLDDSDRITFSGEAGDTVWSNASSYGTLEINYNVNSSDNLTEIRINLTDVDVGEGILAANISLTFDDDNSSWGTATVGYSGTNITINESVWDAQAWCTGTNPFPIDGAGWTNGTIYCRFKLVIDSGASTGTYNTTSTAWKVWFKVES